MPLRFGTYTEFQCPPGRDHAELIWDVIEVGVQADQLGYSTFTCLEHPWFEQFAINPFPLGRLLHAGRAHAQHPLSHALPHPAALQPDGARRADRPGRHPHQRAPRRRRRARPRLAAGARQHRPRRERRALPRVPRHPAQGLERGAVLLRGQVLHAATTCSIVPRPVQKPHPPIWQVGTSSKWVGRAVANGWGICLGGPAPNIAFVEPIAAYHAAVEEAGTPSNFGYAKAVYLDEDNDKAIEEGREPLTNFIHFNVSPMDSLAHTTPEEKQRLIDAALRVLRRRRLPEHAQPLLRAAARVRDRLRRLAREGRAHSSSTSGTSSASTSSC